MVLLVLGGSIVVEMLGDAGLPGLGIDSDVLVLGLSEAD